MGKSIIPFIFENSVLNNIFIEASSYKNISKLFNFSITDFKSIENNKIDTLITDCFFLDNLSNEEIKIKKIFLINDPNVNIYTFL